MVFKEIINREIEMMFGLQKKPDKKKHGPAGSSKESEGDKDSFENSILHLDDSDDDSFTDGDEPNSPDKPKKQLGDFEKNMKKVLSNYS